ncbi:MAG: hypothetical protein K9N47_29155, partial [Prosthecobacter sp.]
AEPRRGFPGTGRHPPGSKPSAPFARRVRQQRLPAIPPHAGSAPASPCLLSMPPPSSLDHSIAQISSVG